MRARLGPCPVGPFPSKTAPGDRLTIKAIFCKEQKPHELLVRAIMDKCGGPHDGGRHVAHAGCTQPHALSWTGYAQRRTRRGEESANFCSVDGPNRLGPNRLGSC